MRANRIFIYCDEPSHAPRRVAVTNFQSLGNGRWNELFTSSAAQGQRESGVTLVNDSMLKPDWDPLESPREGEVRSRYQLVCRKCRRRPVVAREENLFAVLEKLADAGVSGLTLSGLAASLALQSDDR